MALSSSPEEPRHSDNTSARIGSRLPADLHTDSLPLTLDQVRISGGRWSRWQDVNAANLIPHCHDWMQAEGWIDNFRAAAAGTLPDQRRGREFTDSDVYKLVEAMSWENGRAYTQEREDQIRDLIDAIAAAQEPDGYLNTQYGRPGQSPRYSDMAWGNELYNYGHLLQAAVARARSHGPDRLLDVATRVADHICEVFGPEGINSVCGHPEIEVALIEFARLTGQDRYRQQAALFLQRRGHHVLEDGEFGREYYQDDIPIRQATVFRGHAVRAVYLAAAAVDLAVDRDDQDLLEAVRSQLDQTLRARTYLTGGMGSRHKDEAFGQDYELPADRAYSETCAAVGAFMLAWRLLIATDEPTYADLMERLLHNVIAASPATDGRSFFYANTLHQRVIAAEPDPGRASIQVSGGRRAPWFKVSCCPTNVSRLLATLDGYLCLASGNQLTVAVYTDAAVSAVLPDGAAANLQVSTDYPSSGRIGLQVHANDGPRWSLRLRVPAWADKATLRRGSDVVVADPGWVVIDNLGSHDESLELDLGLAPRFVFADPRIDSARSAAAVECGPLVYCLESVDLPTGHDVDDVVIDTSRPPTLRDGRVDVSGWLVDLGRDAAYRDDPSSALPGQRPDRAIALIPYQDWARRDPSTMRVWIRTR